MPINMNVLDNQFRFRPKINGGGLRTKIFPELTGSDFRYGEPLVINSTGGIDYVTQIATAPSAGNISASLAAGTTIVGFALANASGVSGTPVPVLLATGSEVLTRIYNASAGSTESKDAATGEFAEIYRYKDANNQTFMVISKDPNGTDGINKVAIVEKYSLNQASANPALAGEQSTVDDYLLVWVAVRAGLTGQGS